MPSLMSDTHTQNIIILKPTGWCNEQFGFDEECSFWEYFIEIFLYDSMYNVDGSHVEFSIDTESVHLVVNRTMKPTYRLLA